MFRQEMFFQQPCDLAADDASTDGFHNLLPSHLYQLSSFNQLVGQYLPLATWAAIPVMVLEPTGRQQIGPLGFLLMPSKNP